MAPLPARSPGRTAARAAGWLGLLLWPVMVLAQPLSWPGAGLLDALLYPAADPAQPETWALLTFSAETLGAAAEVTDARKLTVPVGRSQVKVDGRVTPDEWADAQTGICRYAPGRHLAVMLKRLPGKLAVGLAAPAEVRVRPGTMVEVGWDSPRSGSQPLGDSHRLLTVTIARHGRNRTELAVGCGGEWVSAAGSGAEPRVVTAAGNEGDGTWAYLAGEALIPVPAPGAAQPDDLGLFVRIRPGPRRRALPSRPSPGREVVGWPDCRSSPLPGHAAVLSDRPDLWQTVGLSPGSRNALTIPPLGQPVKLDGQVREDEWVGAAESRYILPGGQWRTVCYGHDGKLLYVGMRWCISRGLRRREECRLYLDSLGDGGLRPHADDRAVAVSADQPGTARVLRYVGEAWVEDADGNVSGAMARVDSFESHCEFAVPLGMIRNTSGQAGLAVAVAWDSPLS